VRPENDVRDRSSQPRTERLAPARAGGPLESPAQGHPRREVDTSGVIGPKWPLGVPIRLSEASQSLLVSSRKRLEGKVAASALLFAIGLKTSIRSDRMYQFLFEANAWKFLWRSAFKLKPSRYFSVLSRYYGANPEKLRSVEFASIGAGLGEARPAIDAMVHLASPADLIAWFASLFDETSS